MSGMPFNQDLEVFKNLLLANAIDDAKHLLAGKQAAFRESHVGLRAQGITLEDLPADGLSTSLIPQDAGREEPMIALRSTGNGDCLFNSTSIVLLGNESLASTLRLLVAGELYFNAAFYADHEVFRETAKTDAELSQENLFMIALTNRGDQRYTQTKNKSEAVKCEALAACDIGQWSSFMHMMGLASVVSIPIFSIYPEVNFRYRNLMHRVVMPRPSATPVDSLEEVQTINILWSRDGNLDNRPGVWYEPNHFVPVVKRRMRTQVIRNEEPENPASGSAGKKLQQGSLFSFLQPAKSSSAKVSNDVPVPKRTATAAGIDENKLWDQPAAKKSAVAATTNKTKLFKKWKEEFPWLALRSDQNGMICSVCCEAPEAAGKTQFITGSKSSKKETIQIHATSNGHMRAQKVALVKQKSVSESSLARSFGKGTQDQQEKDRKQVVLKMTTAYFIAKEELPFSKFEGLIALQKKNGVDLHSTYANDKSCVQMVSVIGAVFKGNRDFISVMADGATDAGGLENETVFCRFVRDGRPINRLIGHRAVEHAHAEGGSNWRVIFNKI